MRFCGVLAVLCILLLAGRGGAQQAEEWPTLDVRSLAQAAGIPTVEAIISDDPVYGGAKRYRGPRLEDMLVVMPRIDELARQGALVVFHAADGYVATMDLARALAGGGVLATRDLDAPLGHAWIRFEQGARSISPAPLYLVWPGAAQGDLRYVWPYQVQSIEVKPFAAQYGAAVPATEEPAVRNGFEHARLRCLVCHSMNLVGGDLGPELNVPMNVTEYWKPEMLPRYIRDAPGFHARSKMPSFRNALSEAEIGDILAYLRFMADHKVCGAEAPCE